MTEILIKRDTFSNWVKNNPVLLDGEIVYETDTKRFKVGDGKTEYKDLDYVVDPMIAYYFDELNRTKFAAIGSMIFTFLFMMIPTCLYEGFKDIPTVYVLGIWIVINLLIYIFIHKRCK